MEGSKHEVADVKNIVASSTTMEKTREERLEMFMSTFKHRKQIEEYDKNITFNPDKTHSMTFRDLASIELDMYETGGFDVQSYSKVDDVGMILACYDPEANITRGAKYLPEITDCARLAIVQHNSETGKHFDVVHVIKANVEPACLYKYYIRFEARDVTQGITETFEAIVNICMPTTEREVTLVRIRQPPRLFSL